MTDEKTSETRPSCLLFQLGEAHLDIVHILENVLLNQKAVLATLRGQSQGLESAEAELRIEKDLTAIHLLYEEKNKQTNIITIGGTDPDPNVPLGKS